MTDAGPKLLRGLLEVFLLESLDQQPKHGYALLKEMGDTFGAQPNRNRLYPLLAKLVADGYVREVNEAGGNRTLYALTDQGRDALHAYRRLPPQFRRALKRIWTDETHPPPDGGARAPPPSEASLSPSATRTIPVVSGDAPNTAASRDDASDLPYPCANARVSVSRGVRDGTMTIELEGCPMGAYDYCPLCPVHKAVGGLHSLVLP